MDKNDVLIISPFWTGVKAFFLKGEKEFSGMPAFNKLFKSLVQDGRVGTVHTVLFGKFNGEKINISSEYNDKIRVYDCRVDSRLKVIGALIACVYYSFKVVFKHNIFLIYGHGSISSIGAIISLISGVPNCRRLYGTFLASELHKKKWEIFVRHPLEYLSFTLPGKALIITNDGTQGDKVFNKIGNKKLPFYFLLNGINPIKNDVKFAEVMKKYQITFKPEICYIARIDKWKRQHLLLHALIELSKRGIYVKTIISGQVIDFTYFKYLEGLIIENKLESHVKIIKGTTNSEAYSILDNSKLSASFYDFSNLGNVFIESLVCRCVPISENINGSLNIFDEGIYINTNPVNAEQLSSVIISTLRNEDKMFTKSKKGQEFVKSNFLSWEARIEHELEILFRNCLS